MLVCLFRLDSRGGPLSEEETFKPDLNDIKEQAPLRPEAREGRGGKGRVKHRESSRAVAAKKEYSWDQRECWCS